MDQTEPLGEAEATECALDESEMTRDQEQWAQFAQQVRAEWVAAADRLGQALVETGQRIQAGARAEGGATGPGPSDRISEAGLQGRERLVEAATAAAALLGATMQDKQKGMNDMVSSFGDTFQKSSKRARKNWARAAKDLNKTFSRTSKRTTKNLEKTAAELASAVEATGKMAGKQIEHLADSVGDFVEDTTKQIPIGKAKATTRSGQKMLKGLRFAMLANIGAKGAKSMAKMDAKKMMNRRMKQQRRRGSPFPWIAAAGLGAALMYFLDPDRGSGRRDWLSGQYRRLSGAGQSEYGGSMAMGTGMPGHNGGMQSAPATPMWAPGARMLAGVAGGLLAVSGVTSGGFMGAARSALGLGLLAAGSRMRMPDMTGEMAGERALDADTIAVEKTIVVNAPVHEVFNFWRRFDNFPRFMSHVIEVRDLGDNRSHWVVEGPAGTHVSWDARTTRMVSNSQIAWESEPGAVVRNSGTVRFTPTGTGSTRVDVHMTYNPPAGVVGQAVASFFGTNAKQEMDDDLAKFKTLVEKPGGTTTGGESSNPTLTTGPQHFVLGE